MIVERILGEFMQIVRKGWFSQNKLDWPLNLRKMPWDKRVDAYLINYS